MARKPAPKKHAGFEFVDNGRTFSCSPEQLRKSSEEIWWWFRVSTDDRHRYAPFQVSADDTETSVRKRVVAYYDDLLARRAAPREPHWRGPQRPAQPAAAAAASPVAAPQPGSAT